MRYVAPTRDSLDPNVFERWPLSSWHADHADLLDGTDWPTIDHLNAERLGASRRDGIERPHFVAQTPALLADGLHYEQRIAAGSVATRIGNWHDLLNALAWLRYPRIKRALNQRQVAEIAAVGTRERSRAQCALTHFDEGGVIVLCADAALATCWDAHDWHALFLDAGSAWNRRIAVLVFGHAILEHALLPGQLLVGKAIALQTDEHMIAALAQGDMRTRQVIDTGVAALIAGAIALTDPQELRPLPLSGIPGWHVRSADPAFFTEAACFRPLREGRRYAPPHVL